MNEAMGDYDDESIGSIEDSDDVIQPK